MRACGSWLNLQLSLSHGFGYLETASTPVLSDCIEDRNPVSNEVLEDCELVMGGPADLTLTAAMRTSGNLAGAAHESS
ncbi:hypothetical protein Trydic_g21931 [Trypoxylus dichotomus]